MSAVPVPQAFESTRDTDQRVVRLDACASIGDAELGGMHHDVLDRPRAGKQRNLPSNRVHARCLHSQGGSDRVYCMACTHADVHAHANEAEVRELACGVWGQALETTMLHCS
jgi:hypothetical protein